MQQFTRYKKDKIAHFHKDNELSMITTINHFGITYKELYKIIDNSRIFNYRIVEWITNKKCSSCWSFKPHNLDYYYQRNNTKYLYSACKQCMKLLSNAYRIINKKKLYEQRVDYFKDYSNKNKTKIKTRKQKYYWRYKDSILLGKREEYKYSKAKFLREFLFKIKK